MRNQLFLTIEQRRKEVPYPAQTHENSQNYGFKQLKGKPEKAEKIQEARGFPGIVSALKAINSNDSPFFSIGCEKYIGTEQLGGYYASGYIEFAFNYAQMLTFPQLADLFRLFSSFCSENGIQEDTTYNFDLQPAFFIKAKVQGYSCCVWTRTSGHADYESAERAYNNAVQLIANFIKTIGPPPSEPKRIY